MIVKSLCRQIVVSGIAITVIAGVSSLQANDKLQLEIVTIKGSSELPKVLYIVPWKRLKNSDFDQKAETLKAKYIKFSVVRLILFVVGIGVFIYVASTQVWCISVP